jgi:uncharacterized protein (DUF1330 family)
LPKAYIVARVTITDPQAYAQYASLAPEAMRLHGARVLARGGEVRALEGDCRPRNVILEFDSMAEAIAYWESPQYQHARSFRLGAADIEVCAIEGVD